MLSQGYDADNQLLGNVVPEEDEIGKFLMFSTFFCCNLFYTTINKPTKADIKMKKKLERISIFSRFLLDD